MSVARSLLGRPTCYNAALVQHQGRFYCSTTPLSLASSSSSKRRVLPATTYDVTGAALRNHSGRINHSRNPFTKAKRAATSSSSSSSAAAAAGSADEAAMMSIASSSIPLPPLRCPGGPRMKAEGLKHLFKVPHAGYLAKYDDRFILNLKLTHQLASYLSRTTLRTPDKVLVELGPAAGSMTRSLLTRPCVGLLAIEMDTRFNPHLQQIQNYTNGKFQWVNADVLKADELALLRAAFPAFVERHQRKAPSSSSSSSSSPSSGASTQQKGSTSEDLRGGGSGCEGAPLRSTERDRLLRKRFRHHGRTAEAMHSYESVEYRTSPNPALDITDHWWADGDAKVEVIANLPFNVITELLMRYAVDCSRHTGLFAFGRVPLHVFTQMEIAERMTASAGSIAFSRLSVLCQCYFHVRLKQTFSEWTFYPRTEVLGAMLTLEPRTVPLVRGLDGATLIHFTDLLMKPGGRGQTVYKALLQCVPPEVVQYILQQSRMDGAMTVLDLSVEEVATMALMWKNFLAASQQQQQQQQ